jgi:Antitoxin SocA-like, Panacea domain
VYLEYEPSLGYNLNRGSLSTHPLLPFHHMKTDPNALVDLIFKHCRVQHIVLPQMTRLVKLLYLTELEYFRRKRERLTDLVWKFYHYGPYPPALESVLGNPDIETLQWKGGKSSRQLVKDEDAFMEAHADEELEALIGQLVKEWGDADLNRLLDYVYFETEPMQGAKRGEILDISRVVSAKAEKLRLHLDAVRLKELRSRLSERAKEYGPLRRPVSVPHDLPENLEVWDGDRGKQFPTGPCSVRVDDLVPKE